MITSTWDLFSNAVQLPELTQRSQKDEDSGNPQHQKFHLLDGRPNQISVYDLNVGGSQRTSVFVSGVGVYIYNVLVRKHLIDNNCHN